MIEQLFQSIFEWVIFYAFLAISAAFILTFIRLLRGPSLPDRVISLDLITVIAIAFIGIFSIMRDEAVYLDAAIALALVSFLGTVAFARYVEHNALQRGASDYIDASYEQNDALDDLPTDELSLEGAKG